MSEQKTEYGSQKSDLQKEFEEKFIDAGMNEAQIRGAKAVWSWFESKLAEERKANFDITEFSKNVVEWNKKNFGGHYETGYRNLLGCLEELGELSHAHLKGEQGIRHTPEEVLTMKKDAIGDLTVFLLNYCDSQNINYLECLEMVWNELQKRDWTKDKLNGKLKSERDK